MCSSSKAGGTVLPFPTLTCSTYKAHGTFHTSTEKNLTETAGRVD